MAPHRSFSGKPFTSFLILLSFIVILVSGLVLYVAPPGRIANWTLWRLGPLDKTQWQALHTVFALIFVLTAVFHLVFNWRVLLAYLKTRLHTGTSHRREFAAAAGLTVLALALTLAGVAPVSTLVELGDRLKNSWVEPQAEPPVPHAEGLSLARLAETTGEPVDRLLSRLRQAGITDVTADATFGEVAARHGLSPHDLYVRILGTTTPASVNVEAGLGRKTVEQVCRELGIDLEEGLARLAAAGFQASPGDTMRTLAATQGRTPHDILPTLRGK